MNDIEQDLNHMQRYMDEVQRWIDEMQRYQNNMQRSINDRQRKQYLDSQPVNESQTLNHRRNRKEESKTEERTKHGKFQDYKFGNITHVEVDNKVIDLNNIQHNKQKVYKIVSSVPPLSILQFLQKPKPLFFLSLTEERNGVKFKYEKDLGLFSRNSNIEKMVEFLDLFFDATKIPFKMEFTKKNEEILYFHKNCNEH